MVWMIIFWVLISIILYSYFIYGFVLFFLHFVRKKDKKPEYAYENLPEVTLFIAAYNEKDFVKDKVRNSKSLNYPEDKIRYLWVTDGSDDGTPEMLKEYDGIEVLHEPERKGKIGAINRGMKHVKTPIVVFSDSNTLLAKDSIIEIVTAFKDKSVGCVAGEKRIMVKKKDSAVGAGEGIYWKYESLIKRYESEIYSSMGAVGELFAIRKELFSDVEKDTLLDDFIISMRIAMQGYKIRYTSKAYAMETASVNIKEELKRKIRIAIGGIQAIKRLRGLLNPFKYHFLTIQYISHKVLRWTIIPWSVLLLAPLNVIIVMNNATAFYSCMLILQVIFYLLVIFGKSLEHRKTSFKLLFVPYYVFIMNISAVIGCLRFITGKYSHNWEKSRRSLS